MHLRPDGTRDIRFKRTELVLARWVSGRSNGKATPECRSPSETPSPMTTTHKRDALNEEVNVAVYQDRTHDPQRASPCLI